LRTHVGNFTSLDWGENFDGILMANAVHYVKDQADFLARIRAQLSPSGIVLIVEYERGRPNQWVPYPVNFQKLAVIGEESGFSSVQKLDDVPSVFDGVMIYSALLKNG
jgi:hypothetical protein